MVSTIDLTKMESISVSSRSPRSPTLAMNSNRSTTCQRELGGKINLTNTSRKEGFIWIPNTERPTPSIEERRDDYFAVNRPLWRHFPKSTTKHPNCERDQRIRLGPYYSPPKSEAPPSQWYRNPVSGRWYSNGVYYPSNHPIRNCGIPWNGYGRSAVYVGTHAPHQTNCVRGNDATTSLPFRKIPGSCKRNTSRVSHHISRVLFPQNIETQNEIASSISDKLSTRERLTKRPNSDTSDQLQQAAPKKIKRVVVEDGFDKLDLLCSATLELGPLQENPSGCSCPKSKCIALYCDCFKAGRRCDPSKCSCLNCKNTIEESGPDGARSKVCSKTYRDNCLDSNLVAQSPERFRISLLCHFQKAIQAILARNPRAFRNAGQPTAVSKAPHGEQGCNCIRSKCLKLYCACFQKGVFCNPLICKCVGCLNTKEDNGGMRELAIKMTLEKRPDAFKEKSRTKILGAGCACKNNQCVRKYCECFRTKLKCTRKCSCKNCKNR